MREIIVGSESFFVGHQTQIVIAPHSMGSMRLLHSKIKDFFLESFLIIKIFIPKFMKIKCYLGIFLKFGSNFLIKLATFGSILSIRCVSMSKLKLF
jgi:hypothetical protein